MKIVDILTDKEIEFESNKVYAEFGEGSRAIQVRIIDGHVEVSSQSGDRLIIEPRAANVIWVSGRRR